MIYLIGNLNETVPTYMRPRVQEILKANMTVCRQIGHPFALLELCASHCDDSMERRNRSNPKMKIDVMIWNSCEEWISGGEVEQLREWQGGLTMRQELRQLYRRTRSAKQKHAGWVVGWLARLVSEDYGGI